jgi:UDP-N-acetylglucosamine 2-epimerase
MNKNVFWVAPKFTDVSEVLAMMEAAGTSETSVNFYQTTRHSNPEYSHLRTHRRENLKSHRAEQDLTAITRLRELMVQVNQRMITDRG